MIQNDDVIRHNLRYHDIYDATLYNEIYKIVRNITKQKMNYESRSEIFKNILHKKKIKKNKM